MDYLCVYVIWAENSPIYIITSKTFINQQMTLKNVQACSTGHVINLHRTYLRAGFLVTYLSVEEISLGSQQELSFPLRRVQLYPAVIHHSGSCHSLAEADEPPGPELQTTAPHVFPVQMSLLIENTP